MGACCSTSAADAAPPAAAPANNVVDELDIKTLANETHCARPLRACAALRAAADAHAAQSR